jgi:hypothetical protein
VTDVTFEEILPAVKAGGKARRALWDGRGRGWAGCWLELVSLSRPLTPQLVIGYPDEDVLRPFAGANWDLLADDWELL